MTWIFLDKKGSDEYIQRFARGCNTQPTLLETWQYGHSQDTLVIRGIMKHKIIKQCWQDKRNFLYMDSGYMGNHPNAYNPHGWKIWHRVVLNDLQHNHVVSRPRDRLARLGIELKPRRSGSKILIAAPDEKPCKFYGIDLDQWIANTITEIKQHTDRPIEVRLRNPDRQARNQDPLPVALADAHALVTFNSIAATEAIIAGVPAFVLAPCNAARPVANCDLASIEDPYWPDTDTRQSWLNHLAYAQFHNSELADGTAERILKDTYHV